MKILQIVHGFPPESIAGTESYCQALTRALQKRGHICQVLAGSEKSAPDATLVTVDQDGLPVTRYQRAERRPRRWTEEYDPEAEGLIRRLLAEAQPDIVHLHHWLHLTNNIVEICAGLGIPAVVTLHDVWASCPRIHRIRWDGAFCAEPAAVAPCLTCAERSPWQDDQEIVNALALRREMINAELALAAAIILPSEAHRAVLLNLLDLPQECLISLPNGSISRLKAREGRSKETGFPNRPLQIGHWGYLMYPKGAHIILDAVHKLRDSSAVQIHLIGTPLEREYERWLHELARGISVEFHGAYQPSDLQAFDLDLAVFAPVVSESYSFALDEAFHMDLPVLVSDRGALSERIGGAGLTFRTGDANDLARRLQEILDRPELLERLRQGIRPDALLFLEDRVATLEKIYEEAVCTNEPSQDTLTPYPKLRALAQQQTWKREAVLADTRQRLAQAEQAVHQKEMLPPEKAAPLQATWPALELLDEDRVGLRTYLRNLRQAAFRKHQMLRNAKNALGQQLAALSVELNASNAYAKELRAKIGELESEAGVRKSELEKRYRENQELQITNQNLQEIVAAKNWYISEIEGSFSWRLIGFYRKTIKRYVFPPGTRRERIYRDFLKGVLAFHTKGAKATLGKIREKFRKKQACKNLKRERFILPTLRGDVRETINRRVSVVIPTKNAGAEFRACLERIRGQNGLKEIEIIVVDSGSTDNTLDMAERYCAKIVSISPEEFNHGRVRNIGADEATGDYIVFMSQDVIAAGTNCFYNLIRIMEEDDLIAAASVKQIPRSDADVFACWQLWYYYEKVLNLTTDHISSVDPGTLEKISPEDRRKAGQIDNIFSCVKKNVFDSFKFNPLRYAEDLDLGLRLLSKGHKIAFFSSVAAVHSHNRNPAYYFRRSFVDIKGIASLLGFEPINWPEQGITSFEDIFSSVYAFYLMVSSVVAMVEKSDLQGQAANDVIDLVKSGLSDNEVTGVSGGDESLDRLLRQIIPEKGSVVRPHQGGNVLLGQYIYLLESLGDFLGIVGNIHWRKEEFVLALYKIFAVVGGSSLGNFAVYCDTRHLSDEALERAANLLGKGV